MSGTATEYTAAAAARLDSYLGQVRAAVAAAPDLDADDIAADIREHVAAEFRGHTRPVSLAELERVLVALGPPTGWAPVPAARPVGFRPWDVVSAARRRLLGVVGVLLNGPDDWRLAYLCLLLTVLAIPSFGLLLVPAYLLARAAVALAEQRDEPLAARRWLVYPPVVLVSLPVLLAVTLWPASLAPLTYNGLIDPAVRYQELVAEVRGENELILRNVPDITHDRAGRLVVPNLGSTAHRAGIRWTTQGWRISTSDRERNELALRVLSRTPFESGVLLSGFAALGGLLLWGLVAGLVWWQFPRTVAAVFFPLVPADHGAKLAVGCGAGFVVWVGFASRLLDAGRAAA
jgi:hypothetical protein